MKRWTQDQAIEFECACDTIGHLIAIHSHQIAAEERQPTPDAARIGHLHAELMRLARERQNLHVDSYAEIARVNDEYGAIIRAWHAGRQAVAA